MAYGIATSDFEQVWKRAQNVPGNPNSSKDTVGIITFRNEHKNTYDYVEEPIDERPDKSALANKAQNPHTAEGFIAGLEVEYRDAARFVLEAITGKAVDSDALETHELKDQTRAALTPYCEHFVMMDTTMHVANTIETSLSKEEAAQARGKTDDPNAVIKNAMNKMVHVVRDIATLTRPPFEAEKRNREIDKTAQTSRER